MIDVMNKLKEIAESGYDNEDIQRGIDAAATQKFDEESVMERDKQKKMKREDQKLDNDEQIEEEEYAMERDGMKKKMKREDQKLTKDAVEEEEAVEEDAVEEVHFGRQEPDGLQPATLYSFKVAAENRVGRSDFTSAQSRSTLEEPPTGHPRNIKVCFKLDNSQFQLANETKDCAMMILSLI